MTQYDKIKKQLNLLSRYDTASPQFIELTTWCSNQITWAFKFKHISEEQLTELCDLMINIQEGTYGLC